MAKMTKERLLEYINSLPVEEQKDLFFEIKNKVTENILEEHKQLENKASEWQAIIEKMQA